MKKVVALLLLLAALCTLASPALAEESSGEVAPQYTYAHLVAVQLKISNDKARVNVVCMPYGLDIPISIVTYLEKQVNGKWTRFAIPQRYNQWTYGPEKGNANVEYTAPVSDGGTYRAVAVYTLTKTTTETITRSYTYVYTK